MAGKIFINYRRGDDPGHTGRLFDRLQDVFKPEQLFLDVDNIAPGLDFVRELNKRIDECDVLLAVIGKGWIDARDAAGARRLDNPDDFVRIEIEAALSRGKRVIPVLVGGARMPGLDELPEALRALARRNAVRLTHERFRADTQGLIKALQQALEEFDARRTETAHRIEQIERRKKAESEALARADEKSQRTKRDAESQGARARRLRDEKEARREAEGGERRRPQSSVAWPRWRSTRNAVITALTGIVIIAAVGFWFMVPLPGPVSAPAPVAPKPAPITSTLPAPLTPKRTTTAQTQATEAPLSPQQERALKPKDTFKECHDCPEMVVVPAGSFTMGSPANEPGRFATEGPQHTITLAQPFAVGRVHVTVDQFAAFVKASGYQAGSDCFGEKDPYRSWRDPGFPQTGMHPVTCLNWNDAGAYLDWLKKSTGKDYRLLSEAEYEYAIRARITPDPAPRYFFGDDEASMCRYANGADQTAEKTMWHAPGWHVFPCTDGYAYTAPVGSFLPNGFGLFDMVGNVRSWTQDCVHDGYNGAPTDGSAWTSGGAIDCNHYRVTRGGSFDDSPPNGLRSADRGGPAQTDFRSYTLGLRVGRTLLAP